MLSSIGWDGVCGSFPMLPTYPYECCIAVPDWVDALFYIGACSGQWHNLSSGNISSNLWLLQRRTSRYNDSEIVRDCCFITQLCAWSHTTYVHWLLDTCCGSYKWLGVWCIYFGLEGVHHRHHKITCMVCIWFPKLLAMAPHFLLPHLHLVACKDLL